jgi:hypothetical protein
MVTLSESLRVSVANETPFLETGRTLQSVYSDTADLIRYIQETIGEVMGDGNENILSRAGDLAKQAEAALALRQQRVASNLTQIREVADHLGALYQSCDHLGRIAMNLRVVGLNIGVESTRSAEGREMFGVVSKEILQLSKNVDALANRIREDATAATTEQIQAFETISSGLQGFSALTDEASAVTSSAVNDVENGVGIFLKAFETADARFRQISSRVGDIVMGLQFHDNMRQRVEHITDALDDSGRIFRGRPQQQDRAEPETERDDPDSDALYKSVLGRACSVVALQKIQLADVVGEINRVYRESTEAFGEIAGEIEEMGSIISHVDEDIHGTGENADASRDPLTKLAGALTGLNELLGQGDELGRRIEESVERTSMIGRRFSAHLNDVDAIGFDTKIKALNAIVKAGHMSEAGRTLEVLAQEMNRLSEQTNGFVAEVETTLRDVGNFGSRIQAVAGDDGNGKYDGDGDISGILAEGIEGIVRMRGLMDARVEKASLKADALRGVVDLALSDLEFLTSLRDEMSGYLATLDDVNSRLIPLAGKWKTDGDAGVDPMAGRYTMQRERALHESVFSQQNHPMDGDGINPEASDADGGGEVSLWDDETDGEDDEEVTLWENAGPDTEKKDSEEGTAGDFGDNVELF